MLSSAIKCYLGLHFLHYWHRPFSHNHLLPRPRTLPSACTLPVMFVWESLIGNESGCSLELRSVDESQVSSPVMGPRGPIIHPSYPWLQTVPAARTGRKVNNQLLLSCVNGFTFPLCNNLTTWCRYTETTCRYINIIYARIVLLCISKSNISFWLTVSP